MASSFFWIALQLSLLVTACRAQETSDEEVPWYVWLVIAIVFSIAALLIAATLFYFFYNCKMICSPHTPPPPRQREDTLRLMDRSLQENVDAVNPHLHIQDSDVDWELPRQKVRLGQQLGIGEFGPILDTEVQLNVNVVSRAMVKVFQQGTTQDLVRFREDIEAIMKFNHPHVGKLFGVVSHPPYWVILELTVNGDLKTFLMRSSALEDRSKPVLSTPQLVAMATDVASGLAYLESLQYVHKDVAARNCIVTQNLGVKITDFKVGRYLFRSEYAVQADGSLMPLRWMAPESLLQNVFTLSTVTWSFGILVWEVVSRGSFPYPDLGDAEVVGVVCHHHQHLLQPVECPDNIYHNVMLKCWSSDPKRRPKMAVLHKLLESSILSRR